MPDEPVAETIAAPEMPAMAEAVHVPAMTARERLRVFEDDVLGANAMRNSAGEVERGSGSPYQAMNAAQRAHYEALEKHVAAEQALETAAAKLAQATADHAAAAAAVKAMEQ